MKKILKISISAFLAIILTIGCCIYAFAETYFVSNGFTYREVDYGVSVHSWDYSTDTMKIPQLLNGSRVTEIDDFAFNKDANVSKVDFSSASYLRRIGKMCFLGSGLSGNLKLTSSINEIGVGAFQDCTGITDVAFNANTNDIPNQCFMNCTNLSEIKFTNMLKTIGAYGFKNCSSLKEITIPKTVTYISPDAFDGCDNIVLKCYLGSYAQQFAIDNGLSYGLVDPKLGDVNLDGVININDVTYIQMHDVQLITLGELEKKAADVNRDGEITIRDATLIQMYLANIITEF